MYRVLLVPLDGSSESEHALPIASAVALCSEARLRLVHVHEPDITFAFSEGMPVVEDYHETLCKQEERAYLQRICERLEQDDKE